MNQGTLGKACREVEKVDLVMMMLVEKLRHGGQPAHATAIASHITGAPIADVDQRLLRLVNKVGVLDLVLNAPGVDRPVRNYVLNALGAEVLNAEVEGWAPSELEQSRRDGTMASARAGQMRS